MMAELYKNYFLPYEADRKSKIVLIPCHCIDQVCERNLYQKVS